MYEGITFEFILERMMNRVIEKYPQIDTREGSMIYNALAPAAVELQILYIELDILINESFVDSASRENVIRRCKERGIFPKDASCAILKGYFNIDVPIGSRYSLNSLNYIVTEKISTGAFALECETPGEIGNEYIGTLIPIEYIDGLATAELTELLIPGEEETATEILVQKFFSSFDAQAFGGNKADYKEKINSIDGVGGVKVYRAHFGGGSLQVVIINSVFGKPSSVLVDAVQTIIDPEQNQGEGDGYAPIDHTVTVVGVDETIANINTKISFQPGWSWNDVKQSAEEAVDKYFHDLSKEWADSNALIVRISQIEQRLLNLAGVLDIADTTINGQAQNLMLGADCIPKRGELNG